MSVADLSPVDLFALIVFGFGYCALCAAAAYAAKGAANSKETAIFGAGLFCLIGFPALRALALIAP